jgi:hypothetical protein
VENAHELDHGDGRVGVVELDRDLVGKSLQELPGARKRRMMSRSEQETKKYCWMRRSSLPASVLSFG